MSLAKASTALGEPVCRPEFVQRDDAVIEFEELRHPAMCLRRGDFIPNDVKMGGDVGRVVLLTGMRSVAPDIIINANGLTLQVQTWGVCVSLLTRVKLT